MTGVTLTEPDLAALGDGVRGLQMGLDRLGPVAVSSSAVGPATALPPALETVLSSLTRAVEAIHTDLDDCATAVGRIGETFTVVDDAISRKAAALR